MNNKKNLLPKEKESEFNLYLGICEYNERYFCESDYQETIFSKYNEYINNEVENKLDNEESDTIKESNQSSQTLNSDSNSEITNNRTFSNLNDLNDFFWYNSLQNK